MQLVWIEVGTVREILFQPQIMTITLCMCDIKMALALKVENIVFSCPVYRLIGLRDITDILLVFYLIPGRYISSLFGLGYIA